MELIGERGDDMGLKLVKYIFEIYPRYLKDTGIFKRVGNTFRRYLRKIIVMRDIARKFFYLNILSGSSL